MPLLRLQLTHRLILTGGCLLVPLLLASVQSAHADEASARAAMENPGNPLVQVTTARGSIFLEMLANEAPRNVANFLALAAGEVDLTDSESGQTFSPNYYDGMAFHRVIPGLSIQAGNPDANVFGRPPIPLADEINAASLGLDRMPAVLADGSFNPILQIANREDLENILLIPLYRAMNIGSAEEITRRQFEIDERLRTLNVRQVYENLGYRYTDRFPTRPVGRGTVALANAGPNTNGPEFFIAVDQAEWLNGRYTVIGRVVEGMDVVDRINQIPQQQSSLARGVLIYSIRNLSGGLR